MNTNLSDGGAPDGSHQEVPANVFVHGAPTEDDVENCHPQGCIVTKQVTLADELAHQGG